MTYGRDTQQGFVPAEPTLDGLFERMGITAGGFSDLEKMPANEGLFDEQRRADDDLKLAFVKTFSTPHGGKVMEWMLDQSLRRSAHKYAEGQTLEQTALYATERGGQNGIVVSVLKMLQDGLSIDRAPKKKSKKRKV